MSSPFTDDRVEVKPEPKNNMGESFLLPVTALCPHISRFQKLSYIEPIWFLSIRKELILQFGTSVGISSKL